MPDVIAGVKGRTTAVDGDRYTKEVFERNKWRNVVLGVFPIARKEGSTLTRSFGRRLHYFFTSPCAHTNHVEVCESVSGQSGGSRKGWGDSPYIEKNIYLMDNICCYVIE